MNKTNIISTIFVVAVVVVGGYFFLNKKDVQAPVISNTPGMEVFIDKDKTVSFSYPEEFLLLGKEGLATQSWRVNTVSGKMIAKVVIPREIYPKTNFIEAWFSVGTSNDPEDMAKCLASLNGEQMKGTATINGTPYTVVSFSDAGAGNFYETTSYRTPSDKGCYAVEYTIHSGNIGAYSSDQGIKEFNKEEVTKTLEDILKSFKFL